MTSVGNNATCGRSDLASLYALEALPPEEAVSFKAHLEECGDCRREVDGLRSTVGSLAAWPTDLLRPSESLRGRLASRIAAEVGSGPVEPAPRDYRAPDWDEVAPGIFTKILATDTELDRVTMLVRLLPGVSYPPHTHAGVEELHLLDGELWIDDRLLYAGDYNYGAPGASDGRVYSETGCTCVLITSPSDRLR